MNTLEYHETILKKVSFDKTLLKKELAKAVRNIKCGEEPALLEWCRAVLGKEYGQLAQTLMKNKACSWNNDEFNNQKIENDESN